jgi:hypothetical protein
VWIFIELKQKKSGGHGIDPMAAEASYSCLSPIMTSKSAVIGEIPTYTEYQQREIPTDVDPH